MTIYRPKGERLIDLKECKTETRIERTRTDVAKRQAEAANTPMVRLVELGSKARKGQARAQQMAEHERPEVEATACGWSRFVSLTLALASSLV